MRVSQNVSNGLLNRDDVFQIGLWDFKGELIFKSHDQFYGIKGVQAQVIDEVALFVHLGRVDLIKLRHNLDDTFLDLRKSQTGRWCAVESREGHGGGHNWESTTKAHESTEVNERLHFVSLGEADSCSVVPLWYFFWLCV